MNYTNEDDLDGYVAEILHKYESHSSVKNVKDRGIPLDSFNFQCVMAEDIKIRLAQLKTKKSSGYDSISSEKRHTPRICNGAFCLQCSHK